MVRAFVVYETEPDPERYGQHAELCRQVPGSSFRHGPVFGARWASRVRLYAEWEFPDMDAFKAAARTEEFVATGKDAMEMGMPLPGASSRRLDRADPSHVRAPDELGFERIVYAKEPPRATITLNRPEVLNAFDFQMLRELARACEDASWDDEIRVVVLTGAGRAFCVGADLKSWADDYLGNPDEYWKWFGAFKDAHDRLREIGKPTLARINGIASAAATSCRWPATWR